MWRPVIMLEMVWCLHPERPCRALSGCWSHMYCTHRIVAILVLKICTFENHLLTHSAHHAQNIVAIGVGMVDGMGLGTNTKSVIMREGLYEMRK